MAGPESGEGRGEIGWAGGLHGDAAAGARVREGEAEGMQHLAGRQVTHGFPESLVLAVAVGQVTQQGMSEVFEVDPDLMGAAGVESEFDKGGEPKSFEDAVIRPGRSAGAIGDGHPFSMGGMAGDGGFDRALVGSDLAAGKGEIDFIDLSGAELAGKGRMSEIVFRCDDAAAGIPVQAMHNSGAGDPADPAEFAAAVVKQRVDQGSVGMTGGRMHDQPGGFVEDKEIRVFE